MSDGAEIRDLEPSDVAEVQRIHEDSDINYAFPNLESPLFIIKKVARLDGAIIAAGALKIEAELYAWVNHTVGTPEERFAALQRLNETAMDEVYWDKGIDEVVCWVPIKVEKSFAKRMKDMGYSRDREEFHTWSRKTK